MLSQVHLDFDCYEELRIRFNSSKSPINIDFKHAESHSDNLKHASYKISDLEKEINLEQDWRSRF
jgi:hypothetical protein